MKNSLLKKLPYLYKCYNFKKVNKMAEMERFELSERQALDTLARCSLRPLGHISEG